MKRFKFAYLLLLCITVLSCKSNDKKKFTISGNIKNLENQYIYLEQLYFGDKAPDVLDTALVQNGKFSLKATAEEEGLFRLRLEKSKNIYIIINDQSEIQIDGDEIGRASCRERV